MTINELRAHDDWKARIEREEEDARREFAASTDDVRRRLQALEEEIIRLALEIRDESNPTIH